MVYGKKQKGHLMMHRTAIAGVATSILALGAAVLGTGVAHAATPPTDQGNIHGEVTVATALTLQLVNTSFSVSNANPGVSYNGIPATQATVLTNDNGYTLASYMDDLTPPQGASSANQCITYGFNDATHSLHLPDSVWTVTSTGGPGASGAAQSFPDQTTATDSGPAPWTCSDPPLPVTVGSSNATSAASGDKFTEQLAVTVPGNTPGGSDFTGNLTFLATGA